MLNSTARFSGASDDFRWPVGGIRKALQTSGSMDPHFWPLVAPTNLQIAAMDTHDRRPAPRHRSALWYHQFHLSRTILFGTFSTYSTYPNCHIAPRPDL